MFPNDFVNHLKNIWNRSSKRVEQEEKPAIIVKDTTAVVGTTVTFLCYPDNDNALDTEARWKIKAVIEIAASNYTSIQYYKDRNYDKIPGLLGAGLAALYATGGVKNNGWTYLKDI